MNYVWFLILMQTQCISCCRALPFRSYRFSRFLQDVNCTEDSIKHRICQHANGACKSSLDSKRIKGHNVLTKLSSYQEHQSLDQPAPPRPWSRCPPCQSQLQWSWSPLYTDPLWKEKQVYINHRAWQWRNCLNCRNESWEEDRCMFQIIHLCEQSCLRTTHSCHEFMCHKSASITWPNNRATPPGSIQMTGACNQSLSGLNWRGHCVPTNQPSDLLSLPSLLALPRHVWRACCN